MKMTLMQHFAELRRRILWILVIFVFAFGLGWVVAPMIENFLIRPLISVWDDAVLLYTGLSDGLMIQFSLATLIALVITIPCLLWHIWAYIAPGLHKNERQFLLPIFLLSPMLFVVGAAFAFYILFPVAFKFFIDMDVSGTVPSVLFPSMRGYLAFTIDLLKIFGVAFQLPLVLVLLNRVGVLSKKTAIQSRKYFIVIIFICAAILTPPDVISQVILAVPMWLLFETSLLFMRPEQ